MWCTPAVVMSEILLRWSGFLTGVHGVVSDSTGLYSAMKGFAREGKRVSSFTMRRFICLKLYVVVETSSEFFILKNKTVLCYIVP